MDHETERWLSFARNDLAVAKHLNNTFVPKPIEIICYHCQQAAEKALKALFIGSGIALGIPRSHDLSFVLDQVKNKYEIPDEYWMYADTLTPYGVAVRYPNELSLEERHSDKALIYSEIIVDWAEDIIKKSLDHTE